MRFLTILVLLGLLLLPSGQWAHAATTHDLGPIKVRILHKGETFKKDDTMVKATGSFSPGEMKAIVHGVNYWVQRLQYSQAPAIILNVAKVKDTKGGSAYSWAPSNDRPGSDLYDYLVLKQYHPPQRGYDYHSLIVFEDSFTTDSTRALMDVTTIASTMTHELMHAFDMGGSQDEDDDKRWRFESGADAWILRLQDVFGTRAVISNAMEIKRLRANAAVAPRGVFYLPPARADVFSLAPGQKNFFPTFHGPSVDALSGGRGMPVHGGMGEDDKYGLDGTTELGHPAVMGSRMSYAPLRNMLFSELELCMLKDMGYAVNLKKSYGKSYYPSQYGGALTPEKPGDKRSGTLPESPRTVTHTEAFTSDFVYAIGLHVFRDQLTVTQGADMALSGYGAAGVRVDGVDNAVTVPFGVSVIANGENGTGVLVAYGKENRVRLGGSVQATGPGGVGVHMGIDPSDQSDAASYAVEDARNYVNSDSKYMTIKMNSDLNGPLVQELVISGTLTGKKAAVLVDNKAHVASIRVLPGARITGDIVSSWARNSHSQANNYTTTIVFDGSAGGGAMTLNGNIVWQDDIELTAMKGKNKDVSESALNSLHVVQKGGNVHFNGTAKVQSWKLEAGATLSGHGDITLGDGTKLRQGSTLHLERGKGSK